MIDSLNVFRNGTGSHVIKILGMEDLGVWYTGDIGIKLTGRRNRRKRLKRFLERVFMYYQQ